MKKLLTTLAVLAIVACAASASFAEIWTLSGSASAMEPNPNGDWAYGVYLEDVLKPDLGEFYAWPSSAAWDANPTTLYLYGNGTENLTGGAVFYTPTPNDRLAASAGQWLLSGHVAMFAPVDGYKYSEVIRWTAPSDMTVSIDALFSGQQNGCNSDVHVLVNGSQADSAPGTSANLLGTHLFDGNVDGNLGCAALGVPQSGTTPSQAYSGTVAVAAGDHIDFVVGYGADHDYSTDFTGISATIAEVPEPATLSLFCCGLASLFAFAWRKRK